MISKLLFRVTRFHNVDPKKLQSISAKPFFKHYKQAINFCLQNNLNEANEQFTKCLYEIKNSKENELEHYSYIMRRIADNYRRMGQMKNAQQKLYQIIKHKRQCKINSVILYDDYDILFRHMITYDLEKAGKLCKALLSKQKQEMSLFHNKLFHFNLGNVYLLAGNYQDSISRYSKCLQLEPQGKLKSYVYNNMGLAFWWQKNPLQSQREKLQLDQVLKIQKLFNQSKQMFAKSIQIAETQNQQVDQDHKMSVKQILDFKHGSLQNLDFKSPFSLFGLRNLAQFYIANDPLQKIQIVYWLNRALNLSKKLKVENEFDQIYSQYSVLTNGIQQLKEKLPGIIQKYRYSQRFTQQMYYCQLLGRITKQKDPVAAKQYLDRAQLIRGVLPKWSHKIRHLAMDRLDLIS